MKPKESFTQKSWGADSPQLIDIQTMLETWDLDDLYATSLSDTDNHLLTIHDNSASSRKRLARYVHEALAILSAEYPQDAQIVKGRLLDKQTPQAISNQLNISLGHYYRIQKRAIERLAETIQKMNQLEQVRHHTMLKKRLEPPTYIHLIGVDTHLEGLTERLRLPGPPWIFSIEGLGGIGKTSLAHAVTSRTIDLNCWENVAWVTARHSDFNLGGGITPVERPALTVDELVRTLFVQLEIDAKEIALRASEEAQALLARTLSEREHLIVIDNLETVIDLQNLLPLLRRLANPTKFLVTTRESLRNEPDVSHFVVPALNEQDALKLVREEANRNSLPHLMAASDCELRPIYKMVGGNPLALRLITGQLYNHTLKDVLADLAEARSVAVERLYTYIYRQLWEELDEQSRLTLLAMPLVNEQEGTLEFLTAAIHLSPADVSAALNTLIRLNLVNSQGDMNRRYYSIHSLTRSFLHEQVVQWQ